MRRDLMPAILALVLVPLTVVLVLRMMPEPPPSVLAFPSPTHRVAVAVDAAMRSELTSVAGPANSSFAQDMRFVTASGSFPTGGNVKLPDDDSCFWIGLGGAKPGLMRLQGADFSATTRDGRPVKATIKGDPFGEGSVVDFHGDPAIARALAGKIAERLAHPVHKHDSPEDRAALQAFFGPKPTAIVPPPMARGPSTPESASPELDLPPGPR